MAEPERGALFVGGVIDTGTGERGDQYDYEARRFTTHGVIVGMTGSGKTGLGIILLEEALLAGIPTLIIDPKGDMGNLLLNFPDFAPASFLPWVDPAEADRKGISRDELAASTADLWKNGLASWEIGADRMQRLADGADFTIYTPGSGSGVSLNIVGSLAAPDLDWEADAEIGRDEIEGFVSGLLTLAGIDADPISSPEHILLANLIERAWIEGKDLDLATLIGQIINPPFRKLGVFELDVFFPEKDRTALAMQLNSLLASPSFATWMQGEPLDIQSMLYTPDGRPRAAVVYLPHLGETERQFIVTLLLSKVVTWMRGQPGTSDLRALIYMDEVFGFAPPTAEPPSKKPMLTILKQARAHGVGMVVSTQNPVDLDYKAMSNAGTWMVGRLQTERDKARILEGLKSASGTVDVGAFDALIGDLDKRQFVLSSTTDAQPTVFTTRWAMSFLRGPLTRDEIGVLMDGASPTPDTPAQPQAPAPELADDESPVAPRVADGVPVLYATPSAPWLSDVGADPSGSIRQPALVARVSLLYDETRAGVNHEEVWEAVVTPVSEGFDADAVYTVDYDERDFADTPPDGITYRLVDARIDTKTYFKSMQTALRDHLAGNQRISVFKNPTLKLYSRVGETEQEFTTRCQAAAEDAADAEVAKLKDRYKTKIRTVERQLTTAETRVRELQEDVSGRRQTELLGGAGDLLGSFLGGRRRSSGLSKVAQRRSQTRKAQERLAGAEDRYNETLARLDELEDELAGEFHAITDRWDTAAREVETFEIGLEKQDIRVDELALAWLPVA